MIERTDETTATSEIAETSGTTKTIAYFISSHGYGHAARACAVMAALQRRWPTLRCEIFTQTPRWFFQESLDQAFGYHDQLTDIGLVQQDSLRADLAATLVKLDRFLPFSPALVEKLARQVMALGCRMVLCDISPLGIAVAKAAGLPALLVENFTWDWIYRGYVADWPALQPFVESLRSQFAAVDYHVQTEPICQPDPIDWPVDQVTAPVSRPCRRPAAQIRRELGVPRGAKMVLVTMGGVAWDHNHLERLARDPWLHFVIPGQHRRVDPPPNVHLLAHHSGFYHPDLVAASDGVVGKIGYSTLAEVYQAGVPYGYIPRPHFRESQVLARFAQARMRGLSIAAEQFIDGSWVDVMPELLGHARYAPGSTNGAEQTADFIVACGGEG